jgi:hypothetical protein
MASGITILRIAYPVLILNCVSSLLYTAVLTGHFTPPYLTPLVYSIHETMQLPWLQSFLSIWPVAYYFIVGIEVLYLGQLFVTDSPRSEKIDESLSTRMFLAALWIQYMEHLGNQILRLYKGLQGKGEWSDWSAWVEVGLFYGSCFWLQTKGKQLLKEEEEEAKEKGLEEGMVEGEEKAEDKSN